MDYRQYRTLDETGGIFRFTGGIESITDGQTLWIKGNDLTIPISLGKTKCFLMPDNEKDGLPEAPEQIRWKAVSTITEGAKVFIGGRIKLHNNRLSFISTKEEPLMVIFYSCPDDELPKGIIRAARTRNEYWNPLTPASLGIGALILISIAALLLNRPAYRLTVITSFIAVFVPLLPVMPPGFLFTIPCRRLTWAAGKLRIYCDLSFYKLLHGSSRRRSRNYAIRAYLLEAAALLLLILSIFVNIAFIILIMYTFKIISF